jgi:hypothetical protein
VKHLRIYVPGETSQANAEGIQPDFLVRWINGVVASLRSATGVAEEDIKIRLVKAGSVDTYVDAKSSGIYDAMLNTVQRIEDKVGASDRATVQLMRMAPTETGEIVWQIWENDAPIRETRSTAHKKRSRTRSKPMPHLDVYECSIEALQFVTRSIVLRDEDSHRHEAACTSEQMEIAVRLGKDDSDQLLVATVAINSDKKERLMALRTLDEQTEWETRLEEHQTNWSVEDFLKRRGIDLALLKPA